MSIKVRRTAWSRRGAAVGMVLVFASLPLLAAGCGGSSGAQSQAASAGTHTPGTRAVHRTITPTTHAEMARFTGHAGLAFGIFHRYVYAPLRGQTLKNPAQRKRAFAKASAAARAAAHEVVLAKRNAEQSTALRKLFGPLAALVPTFTGVSKALHEGHPDAAAIRSANAAIAVIEQSGSVGGVKITERVPTA